MAMKFPQGLKPHPFSDWFLYGLKPVPFSKHLSRRGLVGRSTEVAYA